MADNWIIPCNIKHFDVITHFEHTSIAVWKNSFSIRKDDVVYIYIGAPYSEILYKCHVVSDAVDDITLKENPYAIPQKESHNFYSKKLKYIQIQMDSRYPRGTFTLDKLREHGLGQVQIQARTDRKLQIFIDEVNDSALPTPITSTHKGGDTDAD